MDATNKRKKVTGVQRKSRVDIKDGKYERGREEREKKEIGPRIIKRSRITKTFRITKTSKVTPPANSLDFKSLIRLKFPFINIKDMPKNVGKFLCSILFD